MIFLLISQQYVSRYYTDIFIIIHEHHSHVSPVSYDMSIEYHGNPNAKVNAQNLHTKMCTTLLPH